MLAYYFPDTLILPVFGGSDTKYHDNPIPDEDRAFFYDYVYRLWFQMLPGNAKMLTKEHQDHIKRTFMAGGYYRVDLTDKISILAMNTLYYDSLRDPNLAGDSGMMQMDWLKRQLRESSGRKFIILNNIYAGARYQTFPLWNDYAN